ncbi:MAG: hypothetical protein JSR78_18275 [Proteobacteria bacterium]|nr:hypothetical protein [Pseudomonadota bacterium]
MRNRDLISVFLLATAIGGIAQPSIAKHRPKNVAATNGDPCAAPLDYVRERIDKIKALRASAPATNGNLFDLFGGKNDVDTQKSAEISNLRYEADGVNALLAAGGCESFNLDQELSQGSK